MLLLVSAGIIAGVAARLLARERERIGGTAREAELGQLRNTAEQVSLAVEVTQDGLLNAMRSIPAQELKTTLREWERSNPLVRNVFIWRGPDDLELPDTALPLTREEQGFLQRYRTLFDGSHGWTRQINSGPQKISLQQQLYDRAQRERPAQNGGWIPWYWENRLGMIGWVDNGAGRYGVELEVIALLSELQQAMPADVPDGRLVALLDGGGNRVIQSGTLDLDDTATPELSVPVGGVLPHWEVGLYVIDGALGTPARGYFILSGLLVVLLFIFLFSAGFLLLREAHRNRVDALQKTTFVSNVSHELKTPLTTIRMYAELLREGRVDDPEKKTRYLGTIAAESERLTRLVNNVLDFGRLEQNRKKYQINRFDLREILDEVVQSQRVRISESGMELTVKMPDTETPVESDRDAIQQALLNLIDNAIKYAAAGRMLQLELISSDGRHRISVVDAGPGIPESHRRKIFERFYRIDDSITARSQGSGLGLGLSRRLLTDLGGSLEYRPAPNGGACFIITLPGVDVS